jgi:hypothetical protein
MWSNTRLGVKNIIIAILAVVLLVTVTVAGFCVLQLRASNQLLHKLSLIKPGVNLADVKMQLGPQMRELKGIEEIIEWGNIKDRTFCREKKLFLFYASTPPCRALEVYTDTNDVVVFATWHGL